MFNRFADKAAIAAVLLTPMLANAAFVLPPEIAEAGVSAGLVGVAVLTVIVGIKAFKWIRRAL